MLEDEIKNRLDALRVKLVTDQKKLFKAVMSLEEKEGQIKTAEYEVFLALCKELDGQKTNAEQREALLNQRLNNDGQYQTLKDTARGLKIAAEALKIEIESTRNERHDLSLWANLVITQVTTEAI